MIQNSKQQEKEMNQISLYISINSSPEDRPQLGIENSRKLCTKIDLDVYIYFYIILINMGEFEKMQ